MVVPVLLLTMGAAVLWLGSRRWARLTAVTPLLRSLPSPVARQHLHLFQGGALNEAALTAAKADLSAKLESGGVHEVETSMRAGTQFVVQVRALAEIGTDEAAKVLERQLQRRITSDPLEQAWYWVDLAQGLRDLQRNESLSTLLRCSEAAIDSPLGHLYAAQVSLFPAFIDYLQDPLAPSGQSALRILLKTLEGLRRGYLPMTLYADAQLGEMVRRLADGCPGSADARLARVFLEAMRHGRRAHPSLSDLQGDVSRRQAVRWQTAHLREGESVYREYLHDIGVDFARQLPHANANEQADMLAAIHEMRTDTGEMVLQMLFEPHFVHRTAAIRCLTWSKSRRAGTWLVERAWAALKRRTILPNMPGQRKRLRKSRNDIRAILEALRGHPTPATEAILCSFATRGETELRVAALKSLGWWEPIRNAEVTNLLKQSRLDGQAEVRRVANAALARLGECTALGAIRDALNCDDPMRVHDTIDLTADEGLTWLWPDLDQLTESDDPSVTSHAWDAVERLREAVLGPLA